MEKEFVAWVPTAGGRLSFSVIGNTDFPSRAVTRNCANDEERFIVSFQRRKFVDSAAPLILKKFVQKIFNQNGDFWFVFVGSGSNCSTTTAQSIEGAIYIFSGKDISRRVVVPCLKEFQSKLKNDCSRSTFDKCSKDFESRVEEYFVVCFDFQMDRDGVTRLKYRKLSGDYPDTKLQELRQKIDHEAGNNRKLMLASQAYFFIKDITHVHQHHGRRSDALINVHYSSIDSADWYSKTLRVLYKRVLEYKRNKDRRVNVSSLGIMAYLDSFIRIAQSRLSAEERDKLPLKYNDNLVASISASDEAKQADFELRRRFVDSFKTWLLGGFGLVVAVAGVARYVKDFSLKENGISGDYIVSMLNLLDSPLWLFFVLAFVILLASLYEGSIPMRKWEWAQDVIRLVQPFKKPFAVSLLLIVAFVFMALAFYMTFTLQL